jgi:hypothetical protein
MDVTTTHLLQLVPHGIEDSGAVRSTLKEGTALEIDPKVRAANRQLLRLGWQGTCPQSRHQSRLRLTLPHWLHNPNGRTTFHDLTRR